jgi:hypothetical protein
MRKPRKALARGMGALPDAIIRQPDYGTEVSTDYLKALAEKIEKEKPANFCLTPISEAGW